MNPWYTAWLKPDCMVGANTKSRKDLAANRDISDNFKQRLRACMDPTEYDRLMGGAVPVARAASNSVEAQSPNPGSVRPPQRSSVGVQTTAPVWTRRQILDHAARENDLAARSRSRSASPAAARYVVNADGALDLVSRSQSRSPAAARAPTPGLVPLSQSRSPAAARAPTPVPAPALSLNLSSRSRSPSAARAPTPVPVSRNRSGSRRSPEISSVNTQRGSLNNSVAREILEGANEVVDRVQRDRASPAPRGSRSRDSWIPDFGPPQLDPPGSYDGSDNSLAREMREREVRANRKRGPPGKKKANAWVEHRLTTLQEEAEQGLREEDPAERTRALQTVGRDALDLIDQFDELLFNKNRSKLTKLIEHTALKLSNPGGEAAGPSTAPAPGRRRQRTDGDVQEKWASMYTLYRDLVRDAVKRKDREECARILEDLTDILSTYGSQLQKRTRLQYEKLRDRCSAEAARSSGSARHSSAEISSAEQRKLTDAAIEVRTGNRQQRQNRMADLERFAEAQRDGGRGNGSNSETESQIRRRVVEKALHAMRREAENSSTSASSHRGGRLRQQVSFSESDDE